MHTNIGNIIMIM